ncbi:MAG: hypothetical protein VXX79_13120, partial [Pseudomonadota bacterium]|nr:hypothetical protein [Pseudomonadota bacterium]
SKVIPLVEKQFVKHIAEINPAPMPAPKPLAMAAEEGVKRRQKVWQRSTRDIYRKLTRRPAQ